MDRLANESGIVVCVRTYVYTLIAFFFFGLVLSCLVSSLLPPPPPLFLKEKGKGRAVTIFENFIFKRLSYPWSTKLSPTLCSICSSFEVTVRICCES